MLKLYNTLTGKKEIFKPRKSKKVNLFVCGITPYDLAHLGHARTCVVFDMIVKYLRQKGCDVFYLQNITDIDDKIIKRAKEKNISWLKLSRKFEKEYLKEIKILKISSVNKYARATDHIKEIISQVGRLLKQGYAYKIEDGIYYDISKFKDYGKLSGRTVLKAEDAVSRIDESKKKRNKGDFCLWKFKKPGEPSWPSPWGKGRPGWHIEDTAITEKFFGPQYDVHGGGRDLIFPHHEAEIAQMEAISDKKPLVKYWLHTGFLTVGGTKMAKSLGNFITVKSFLEKYSPRLLRFIILKNHYRSPFDYTEKSIRQAEKELEKIDQFVDKIRLTKNTKKQNDLNCEKDFRQAVEDDFNTPKALGIIFKLIKADKATRSSLNFLKEADKFFNFIFQKEAKSRPQEKVLKLTKLRQKHRDQKNWQKADEIRKRVERLGWLIEDTVTGPKLKKII